MASRRPLPGRHQRAISNKRATTSHLHPEAKTCQNDLQTMLHNHHQRYQAAILT
ncbi:hypothetical protein M440DRAFT_1399139 [Trichoderma longibrachiatum ATCC 18648]|uniref:Uncharacterized protein n=1 Tax=Trichoderma longibrachiatum ATCC 18648 TaxID=983965 RepID=A0A2T4CE75_TRILO|nr:hypothetical protein M440DRAFT_1399139 [Trichoderma longibrachiatum ATCC 18648]